MAHITDKLFNKKWGIFTHFLARSEENAVTWAQRVNAVDTDYIAKTLHEIKAGYYCITMMQGWKFMIAPNETFDRITGNAPGEACSQRDLPLDLYHSLQKYGIDLYLYFTGDGPYKDLKEGSAFGFAAPRAGGVTEEFVTKWAGVLREYAVRYGDKVEGWWVDGCYRGTYEWGDFRFNEGLVKIYYNAIKAGNPQALTAFNDGVKPELVREYPFSDFTGGEQNDFTVIPPARFIDGAQAHILAPLGTAPGAGSEDWGKKGCKRNAEYISGYINKVNANGGVVTVDVHLSPENRFDDEQLDLLRSLHGVTRS